MLGTLGDAALEAHGGELGSDFVAVDKLGVADYLGLYAEELMQAIAVGFYLLSKFLGVDERCERVGVCLGDKLHLAGGGELAQQVDKLGHVLLELLQGGAGDGERAAEGALGLLDHAQEGLGGGDVALGGYAGYDVVVEKVIVVVVVVADVKETVALQTVRLMYGEVETDCFHGRVSGGVGGVSDC